MDHVFVPARRHYNSGKRKVRWMMELGIKTLFYAVFMCIISKGKLFSYVTNSWACTRLMVYHWVLFVIGHNILHRSPRSAYA